MTSHGSVAKSCVLLSVAMWSGIGHAIQDCHGTETLSVKESCCDGTARGCSAVSPPEGAADLGGCPPSGQCQPLESMCESSLLRMLLCGLRSTPPGWVIVRQTHRGAKPL